MLQLQRNLTDQVTRISEWILSEAIVGVDIPLLYDHLADPDHEYNEQVAIARHLNRYEFAKSPYINVQITRDELTAYLSILGKYPQGRITPEDCLYCLLAEGVRSGFQPDNIREALERPLPVYMIVGAEGRAAEAGKDSEIILHEAVSDRKLLVEGIDGRAMVVRDEVIAQKLAVKPGKPGTTVTGKMLVKQVNDIPLPAGEHTYIGEDKLTLYAAIDGYLEWDDDKLAVRDVLHFDEDIDYRIGDVHYNGRIVVNGDVRAGVTVTAEKDVEVLGCVEGGGIVSRQGSIHVHRGVNGLEKSYLSAGQEVVADYIQDASISAGGGVNVKRYVARSEVQASGEIMVRDREGLVRGGMLWSGRSVQAKVAGSSACSTTVLGIRPKLTETDYHQLTRFEEEIEELNQQQNRLRRRLDFLSLLEQRQNQLSQTHQNEVLLRSEELIAVSEEIVDREDQILDIQQLNSDRLDFSKPLITIQDRVYPGVKFVIEEEELLIQQEMGGVEISYIQGQLYLNTLDG
ncbi:MAG TPA: FapA family protein [bacterium]|nr:FapA family protein [bacterium]